MNYYSSLPPLSPDYAGAGSVFFDYGGTIVINGPSGCLANYAGYDEPRYFTKKSVLLSSGFRDVRAIFGDEDFLIESLPKLEVLEHSNYLLLLSSPSAAVIGTDHSAIAHAIEDELNIPVFSIETCGIYAYDQGASQAYVALGDRYLFNNRKQESQRVDKSVALVGLNPLDYWGLNLIEDVKKSVTDSNFTISCTLGIGGELSDIANISDSEYILVCSYSALALAKKAQEQFSNTLVCGLPVGEFYSTHFEEFITAAQRPDDSFTRPSHPSMRVLVIGQQMFARSYRLALEQMDSAIDVTCASLFSVDRKYFRSHDKQVKNEGELKELISEGFDLVVADPLIKRLVPKNTIFVQAAHMAVSSRLFADQNHMYVGPHGLDDFISSTQGVTC